MVYSINKQPAALNAHARKLFDEQAQRLYIKCDHIFAALLVLEWIAAIGCALIITPRTWIGATSTVHLHVWAATLPGGLITSVPMFLALKHPGTTATRQAIAIAQMMYSSLLIHLTGGRIETHFHIFGSLAFLAFYRDWRVLLTATVVVALDHFLRGMFWSESVFGVVYASQWRWVEHAGWVVFEDIFLFMGCYQGHIEMAELAHREAEAIDSGIRRSTKLSLALSERDDLLAALDSGVIMVTTDANETITSVNERFCQISGYSREELIGQTPRIVDSAYHSAEFWEEMHKTVNAGGTWRKEVRSRAKDGRQYWVDNTIKGILGSDGKLQKIVAVQADITDRKTAEEQLHQSQRLESIGQLAAGIAHEINTPTQYASDNMRFLREECEKIMKLLDAHQALLDPAAGPVPWEQRKAQIAEIASAIDLSFLRGEIPSAIEQSLEGMERIATIVRAMKDFSHPGSTIKEPADLNRAITSTVEVCRTRWKYAADLQLDLAEDLPNVPCLLAEFNQVILNLIVNAADAITENVGTSGEQKGLIRVSSRSVGDHVEVRVTDNGKGIPEAIKARMFEQFFTTKPVGKGTGQGLALSRNVIVKKHGGKISFESVEGMGTTFIIELPLAQDERKPLEAA
jgi:PAS domain S-box-containing protein